jgi:hypothetical protein
MADATVLRPEHSYVLDYTTLVKPTYEKMGSIHYVCVNTDCNLFLDIKLPKVITSGKDKNATVIKSATEDDGEIAKYSYTNALPFDVTVEIAEVLSAPAIGHNYEYSFANKEMTGVGASIVGTCSNTGCANPVVVEKVSKSEKLSDMPANCTGPAKQVWKVITESGMNLTINIVTGTEKGENHVLGGKDATTLDNYDGSYFDNIAGIKVFGGKELACDEEADGYYTCDACGGLVQITVRGAHKYTVEVETVPTLTAPGTAKWSCSKCKTTSDTITLSKIVLEGASKNATKISESSKETVYDYTVVISIDEKVVVRIKVPKA